MMENLGPFHQVSNTMSFMFIKTTGLHWEIEDFTCGRRKITVVALARDNFVLDPTGSRGNADKLF